MSELNLWQPINHLETLANTLMGFPSERRGHLSSPMLWRPPVDLLEEADRFVLLADLPGMKKEDIDIQLEENVLTLKGKRTMEQAETKENVHCMERVNGAFSRSFSLGTRVEASKIKASYEDGVLTISLPKAEEAKPRRITIKA